MTQRLCMPSLRPIPHTTIKLLNQILCSRNTLHSTAITPCAHTRVILWLVWRAAYGRLTDGGRIRLQNSIFTTVLTVLTVLG